MEQRDKIVLILAMMAFLANGDTYAAGALMIPLANDLGITTTQAAMSVTSYMIGFGVFTLLFGPLSDRYGKAKVINFAAIGTALFSLLGALSFNLESLAFFRFINGALGAGILPVTFSYIGESFNGIQLQNERQKALGKVLGLAYFGTATATFIGGTIAHFSSWRMVYVSYGALELALAISMLLILPKDKPKVNKLEIITFYKKAFASKELLLTVSLLFFIGFAVLGSFSYIGVYIASITNYNTFFVGLTISAFGFGALVGAKSAAKLRLFLQRKYLLFAGLLGLCSYILLVHTDNIMYIVLAIFGFGFAFISVQSTMVGAAQEKLPEMKGTAMSLASFCLFTGASLGTFFNGIIKIETIFTNSAMLMLVIGCLSTIIIYKKTIIKKGKLCRTKI